MIDHKKTLAYLYIGFNLFTLALCLLIYSIYAGGMTTLGILNDDSTLITVTGIIGFVLFMILLITTLPGIIAGFGLLKNKSWAKAVSLIIALMYLIAVPVGTILGIYALWVLLSDESKLV